MRWIAAWRERVRALLFGARQETEMDEELRFHLERETELLRQAGLKPREARRQAQLRFGGVERVKEEVREARGIMVLEEFSKDVTLALRGLRRSPGFTAVALSMLALGIGANSAIFSVIHTVLLEPLPFEQPAALVQVFETHMDQGWDQFALSEPNLLDLMEESTAFDGIAGTFGGRPRILSGEGSPERVETRAVTPGFYRILGVTPVLGRTFDISDVRGQQPLPVLLLSEDAWATRFGADPTMIGRTVRLDGSEYEVVGVLPRDGPWLREEFYLPMALNPESGRDSHNHNSIARLHDGVTIEAARTELALLAQRMTARNAPIDDGMGFRVEPATIWAASADLRLSLWVLMGAVGFLLLIACMNLANLLLSRVANRRRQVALCVALGASRARVVRQLFTESAVLGIGGSVLGIVVAAVGLQALAALDPGNIPQLENVELDGPVLFFTLSLALATSVLGGLLPALRLPCDRLSETLRDGGRSGHGRSQARVRSWLVASETALSLVLLVGAGLLIRSLVAVHGVDPGFDPEGRLTFTVNLPSTYNSSAAVTDFRQQFLGRLRAQPQVQSAAAGIVGPMSSTGVMVVLPGGSTVESFGAGLSADWRLITDDYFESIGRRVVQGRDLSHRQPGVGPDDSQPPLEAVISRRLADAVWPGENAVGRQLQAVAPFSGLYDVVGVVEDMRERGPAQNETLSFYLSLDASPILIPFSNFVVHATGEPRALVPTLRGILEQIDPDLPMSDVVTMDELLQGSTASRRFTMSLLAMFAGVALVLALSGLYGVIADSVSQRSRELGVRVAMGASPSDIMGLVLRQGMLPAVLGIGVGLVAAVGFSRVLQSLLFEVAATDAVTYASMGAFLTLAALAACWAPAYATVKLDPVAVLKEE
jgi:predicted permease